MTAPIYISAGSAHLEGFEKLVGLKVIDSYICGQSDAAGIDSEEIPIYRPTVRKYKLTTAKVIYGDSEKIKPYDTCVLKLKQQ
ncbi:MAG: hypothetical protein IJZ63_02670 [Clostridia bacterium]|nr:hypothetical protein [Clostridia bacterium]